MLNPHHLYSRAAAAREMNVGLHVLDCLIREGKLQTQRAGQRQLVTGVSIAQVLGLAFDGVPAAKPLPLASQAVITANRRLRGF